MRKLVLLTIVLLCMASWCHAQETTVETQPLSPGETLKRVEETLHLMQTQKVMREIELLRKLEKELNAIRATDSVLKSQVEADLEVVQEGLAHHDLLVAAFYMEKNHAPSFRGAASRLENITKRYPKFSKMDQVFYRLIVVSLGQEQKDLAIHYSWSLICNFPQSEYLEAAFDRLNTLGVSSWEGCQKFLAADLHR